MDEAQETGRRGRRRRRRRRGEAGEFFGRGFGPLLPHLLTTGNLAAGFYAIVTAPINKKSWKLARCRFPGHTEKLADALGVKRFTMAFMGGGLCIALASAHLGLFELRSRFTLGMVFQSIDLLHHALTQWR